MKHSTLNTQHSTLNTLVTLILFRFKFLFLFFIISLTNGCQQSTTENEVSYNRLDPGESCYDEVVTTNCQEDSMVIVIDSIPSFPNCEITLSIKYCLNQGLGLTQVATGDYRLISTCQELQDSITYKIANNTDGELNIFFASLDEEIYQILVKKLFEAFGDNGNCGSEITYINEYIRPSCFAYCLYSADVPIGEDGRNIRSDGEDQQVFWSKSTCGSDGCCLAEYSVCYDAIGDSIRVTHIRTSEVRRPSILEECSNGTPDAIGDPSTIRCLPCDFNCE